jgi:hypothetical protein
MDCFGELWTAALLFQSKTCIFDWFVPCALLITSSGQHSTPVLVAPVLDMVVTRNDRPFWLKEHSDRREIDLHRPWVEVHGVSNSNLGEFLLKPDIEKRRMKKPRIVLVEILQEDHESWRCIRLHRA